MSNPKMGPNETITGLELLMKLSRKDRKKLISKLLNGELPIDRGSNTQQESSPASEKGAYVASHEDGPFEFYHENGRLKQKCTYAAGEYHGPYESYENGQLVAKGVWNMGEACGEWIVDGETVTYPPCPPDPEDGN